MKKEMLKKLVLKTGVTEVTEQDLADGVTVRCEDWDEVLAMADEVHTDKVWDEEWAIVDGVYVTYDPYEGYTATEV